ncbi:alpha-N-acetylglucosaminidase [Sesbania bispinosa]|nr:alpha-N-acetylglucosaminidase [Sesbania bispinosa]
MEFDGGHNSRKGGSNTLVRNNHNDTLAGNDSDDNTEARKSGGYTVPGWSWRAWETFRCWGQERHVSLPEATNWESPFFHEMERIYTHLEQLLDFLRANPHLPFENGDPRWIEGGTKWDRALRST